MQTLNHKKIAQEEEQLPVLAKPNKKAPRISASLKLKILTAIGCLAGPAIWICLKHFDIVSDRYLPAPIAVLDAFREVEPNILVHFAYTSFRLVAGFIAGAVAGIMIGIFINRSESINRLLSPSLQSMRSIPAIATVPFFLLWFGFSEWGKIILVVTGIAFNVAIATHQVLRDIPEKDRILFKSFDIDPTTFVVQYSLPRIFEALLPTLRFSLTTAVGVVIVSELLGAQIGLGYLIQTSRSTFSIHVIFLCMLLLGVLNSLLDIALTKGWSRLVYWKSN
ncbi:ABC transporter permease subunit [bacterium]|nr:ABC transporter permease subunit [bacterium]QQR57423.1 MAG: ABC transporter permease subunit [Candidatus Melainabacteria bacterium]